MLDNDQGQGNEGQDDNDGFASEFARLRDVDAGADDSPPDDASTSPEPEPGAEPSEPSNGQDAGGDPPADDKAAQSAPAEEKPDDLWANADPRLREAFEAERQARSKAENTIRSQNGRLSQAHHRLAELEASLQSHKDPRASDEDGTTGNESKAERMAQLREEYPDLAAPILDELDNLRQTVARLDSAHTVSTAERTEQAILEQEQALAERHPSWSEDVLEPTFAEWAQSQPRAVQEAIVRNGQQIVDAAETAWVLDLYKQGRDTGDQGQREQERRQAQLEAARTGTPRQPAVASTGAEDFNSAWKQLAAEDRRKAQRR